jgi:hypothetical protein
VAGYSRAVIAASGIGNFARATHVVPDLDAIATAVAAEATHHARGVSASRRVAPTSDFRFLPPTSNARSAGAFSRRPAGLSISIIPTFMFASKCCRRRVFSFLARARRWRPADRHQRQRDDLVSGGIDSPVAAWRMMRRGCRTHFVHFHSYPILSATSQEKVREIVRLLTRFQLRSKLFLVPFGAIQQQVVVSVPPALGSSSIGGS